MCLPRQGYITEVKTLGDREIQNFALDSSEFL